MNEQNCRGVIATNFAHSFCGSALVKAIKPTVNDLVDAPKQTTSDGTPIDFLGEAMVQLELGPWQSDGLIPLLVAWDCPADVLIGQDLITEIGKKFPVKFEFYKNAVNIGGTRVSMLDPLASEEKFISVVVKDPRTDEDIGLETWKKGNKEVMEPGGLVKRRVEVISGGGGGSSGAGHDLEEAKEDENREEDIVGKEFDYANAQGKEAADDGLLERDVKEEDQMVHCYEENPYSIADTQPEQCGDVEKMLENVTIGDAFVDSSAGTTQMTTTVNVLEAKEESEDNKPLIADDDGRNEQFDDGAAAAVVENPESNDGDYPNNAGITAVDVEQQHDEEAEELDCEEV